jgi:aminoglycoside phosphotransferase (APT) family kinase protein
MGETVSPRPGEQLDVVRLAVWLQQPIVSVAQFPGGHSNLTYLIRTPAGEMVLRRPPLGPVAPKAHDMAREARLLQALSPLFPPAPRVLGVCEDPQVLGAPFFLMDRRHGIVIRGVLPEAFASATGRISEAFLETLVQLHSLDPARVPVGKPEGFLARQVQGWAERWRRARTGEVEPMERIIAWLDHHLPPSPPPAVIHNDYKLDNLMFDPDDPARVTALLDWEMATLGDPLADLGLALAYWAHAEAPGLGVVSRAPGFWTRDQLVDEYARRTRRDVSGLAYYEVLGVFKLAVILQQIYYRYAQGQTRDERFRSFDRFVLHLAAKGEELIAAA